MALYVVRHAKAGHRKDWSGDDRFRPLNKAGWAQAEAIADRLAGTGITSLHASPYTRCVQSLEPLADREGMKVSADERLAEGATFEAASELLREAGDGAVLCSHGDIVPELITGLRRRGMDVTTEPDWRKGTIWVLELDGDHVISAAVEPPPDP